MMHDPSTLPQQPATRHVPAAGVGQRTGRLSRPLPRGGFTLIEMLVVISVGSSIMLTAIALVHTAFRLQSQAQSRFERSFTKDRFIECFRADVRMAHRAELSSEKSLTLFHSHDQRVEYGGDAGQLTRSQNTKVAKNPVQETTQFEQVKLPAGSQVRFSRDAVSDCIVLEVFDTSSPVLPTVPSSTAANEPSHRLARRIIVSLGQAKSDPQEQL